MPKVGTPTPATGMAEGVESLVISLYAKGMSNSQLMEMYDFRLSTNAISRITDRVTGDITAWQNRPR